MKIYPSRHSVVQDTKIDLNSDIPLAYVDTGFKEFEVSIIPSFSRSLATPVIPYTGYGSLDVCLFDKNGEEVNNTSILQRDKDKYYYIPQNATSFNPQRFTYTVTGKKQMPYKSTRRYDLAVSCLDDENFTLSKKLMRVFGDAPTRGICPANVMINGMDVGQESLTTGSFKESDFLFAKAASIAGIDLSVFLNEHANVWAFVDTFPVETRALAAGESLGTFREPMAYNEVTVNERIFDAYSLPAESGVRYHNLYRGQYSNVLIKEYEGKGFVIITPTSFLDNIEANIKLLYEVMMFVYGKTYVESEPVSEWITDVAPDYVVVNNVLTRKEKFTSNLELYKIFNLDIDEVALSAVEIQPENVKFDSISNNYIVFRKEHTGVYQKYADPVKPTADTISVFTPRQNVIFYKDFIYEIEEPVQDKVTCVISDDTIAITVKPLKNSVNGIHTKIPSTMTYRMVRTVNYKEEKLASAELVICCKNNILSLVEKRGYANSDGIIIAEIQIYQSENKSSIYDMRQRGGGLPEDKADNRSLLDIGNVNGLAYRKAGTIIFTLPKRLEPHEELILKAIRKHITAEELPIILFEDREDA